MILGFESRNWIFYVGISLQVGRWTDCIVRGSTRKNASLEVRTGPKPLVCLSLAKLSQSPLCSAAMDNEKHVWAPDNVDGFKIGKIVDIGTETISVAPLDSAKKVGIFCFRSFYSREKC